MKKTWVKRENIYYKPFYKQKSKVLLLCIFLLGVVFFLYQAFSINQLPNTSTPWSLDRWQQKKVPKPSPLRQTGDNKVDDEGGGGGGGAIAAAGGGGEKYHRQDIFSPEKLLAAATGADEDTIKIIRGIRLFDYDAYKPNFEGKFKCLDNSAEILFDRVNDNYCDCLGDGSDEPSTNACAKGRFYCRYQKRHITGRGRDVSVPSSRVNDGVCDCCDGSDEWETAKCAKKCA